MQVSIERGQLVLLKFFLIMYANIKALLRDIEYSFNAGYLCKYSKTGIEINNYYWTKTRKIAVTTILTRVCSCTHVIC